MIHSSCRRGVSQARATPRRTCAPAVRVSAIDGSGTGLALRADVMIEQLRRSADRIEQRLEFETLISDTAAALFAAPAERDDPAIERALERVRGFFQADRCALLSVSANQQLVNVRLASYAEGVSRVPSDINLVPLFPWGESQAARRA
jgi:hypothetical protein